MEIALLFTIFLLLVVITGAVLGILTELQILNKKIKDTEVVDERITRRDINGDYGFRNPLKRSAEGYKVNKHGQYVPTKPNVVGEEEDV